MMINKSHTRRSVNRGLKFLIGALPAIPYLTSRKRTPVEAYVLGGVAVALVGGISALMFFSPRTRSRTVNAAKGTYQKMNEKIVHRRKKGIEAAPMLSDQVETVEQPTAGV